MSLHRCSPAFALCAAFAVSIASAALAQPAQPKPAPAAAAKETKPSTNAKDAKQAKDVKDERPSGLASLGGNSKEPIKIDADRLDVFDKESKAVFKGNVVAIQGESTMKCSALTVLYEQQKGLGARPAGSQSDSIKELLCDGPVTVVSKDQVATGDKARFDRAANKVVITGNVALSQCQNVTRGERVVYDMNTGVANIETAPGGRVRALFVPGGSDDQGKKACEGQQQAQPQPGPAPQPQPAAKPSPKRAQVN